MIVLRLLLGNLILLSQLSDQEDSNDPETNRVAGEYNVTVPQMPPHFTKPGNMNRFVPKGGGTMLHLECPAEGNPEPNITWTKDGAAPHRNLGHVRYGRWSLLLEDLVESDSGNYMCLVCNLCDCINFTFKVAIFERYPQPPYIKDGYPQNVTALVNTTATFQCPTYSDLEHDIIWARMSRKYDAVTGRIADNKIVPVKSRIPTDSPEELVLSNVSYEDEGWYTCFATDSVGDYFQLEQTYASAYLHVVDKRYPQPPYIKDGYPQNVTALVNTAATFKCLTYSDLEPHIQWVRMSHKFEDGTDRMEDNITIHGKVREGVGAGGECWSNLYSSLLNKHHEPASANCFFT